MMNFVCRSAAEPRHDVWDQDVQLRIKYAIDQVAQYKIVKPEDRLVVVTGHASGPGATNTMRAIVYRP